MSQQAQAACTPDDPSLTPQSPRQCGGTDSTNLPSDLHPGTVECMCTHPLTPNNNNNKGKIEVFFETQFYYVAPVRLELAMLTRLAFNSQEIDLSLTP